MSDEGNFGPFDEGSGPELTPEILGQLRRCSISVKEVLYGRVDDIVPRWTRVVENFVALNLLVEGDPYAHAEELVERNGSIPRPRIDTTSAERFLFVNLFLWFITARENLEWLTNFSEALDSLADALNDLRSDEDD